MNTLMNKTRREINCFQKKECLHKEIQNKNMMKYPATEILNPLIRIKGENTYRFLGSYNSFFGMGRLGI